MSEAVQQQSRLKDLIAKGKEQGYLTYAEVMERLSDAEDQLGRPINPTIYEADQFAVKLKKGNSFIKRVMDQPKLWIKGEENDIGAFR